MTNKGPIIVKHLPERQSKLHRGLFLDEIKHLVGQSYRPRLIVDLTACPGIKAEPIDLLLECVEEVEHVDGRVSVAAPNPETAVILELTQLTSVLDMFPSVSEAMGESSLCVLQPGPDGGTSQVAA
jgi:anti-anti-sigma regulatory factor